MKKRESDLEKAIGYAELLGIEVKFVSSLEGNEVGNYYPEQGQSPPTIYLYNRDKSVFQQLLILLHELGHHIDCRERKWNNKDYKALELANTKLNKAPKWAKKIFWDLEEYANWNLLQIARHLEIKLPEFLFWYDMEKARAYTRLEFEFGKIPKLIWRVEKRKIRQRLLEKTPSIESYCILSY